MAAKEKIEEVLIINRRTGKALQCMGSENGSAVVQSEITGEDSQLWILHKAGKQFKVCNKACGKLLDVIHGSIEAGAWAHVWEDVDGESQLWQWVKVTSTYKKLMNTHSGKVLDIVDMREDDGAPIQIWDDVDGEGQQWKTAVPDKLQKAKQPEAQPAQAEEPQEQLKLEEPAQQEKPAPKKTNRRAKKTAETSDKPKTTAAGRRAKPKA